MSTLTDSVAVTPESIWQVLESFFDPDTGVIYDSSLGRAALPSREQVLDDVPNQCGWMSDFEDAALNAGLLLPFVIRLASGPGGERWAGRAHHLAGLLLSLATVSETPGFLARAVLPDGVTHYRDSSTDQYTMAFHALVQLSRWPEAGREGQRAAARFVADALKLMQRHGWDIPTEDGERSWVGETSQLRPDRSSRLLQFALTAATLNDDTEMLAQYRMLRDEHGARRTRRLFGGPGSVTIPYALLQTQISLRALWEQEPDAAYRTVWRNHMNDLAEHAVERLESLDMEEVLQRIAGLPGLPEPVGGLELYTAEDYASRRDVQGVAAFADRWWQHNPRLHDEYHYIRGPLELVLCYALADEPELAGNDGRPLLPLVQSLTGRIFNAVPLNGLRFCHSAVAMFGVAAATQPLH